MERSENAIAVYKSLYMNKDQVSGETTETVDEVHSRVAACVSKNTEQGEEFYRILDENIFRPNSPCLINAWKNDADKTKYNNNLVACFVVGLKDNMNSIIDLWNTCANVYAGGGGTGFCISNLREAGAPISIGGQASGPIEYMKVVQSISDTVKSGGKARRAANLASFWYQHPDILKFISCKKTHDFSAVNISILVDDIFMSAVEEGRWEQKVELRSPNKSELVDTTTVGEIWQEIIQNAWASGDPGLLFYDETNRKNPIPSIGEVLATNPCGEVPLFDDSCCDLGSLNMNKFLVKKEGQSNGNMYKLDYDLLKSAVKTAVEFLDNIIDTTSFPNKKFEETMTSTRPLGLGLMGFADILYKMNIPYGSDESIQLFKSICKTFTVTAFEHSIDMAANGKSRVELGKDESHFRILLKSYGLTNQYLQKYDEYGIHNTHVTSLAPTGSISISAECCYAFEPMMALIWEKPLADKDQTLKFINDVFRDRCTVENIALTDELMDKIVANKGSINGLDEFSSKMQSIFVTAHDVGWSKKIDMQAAGQEFISLAISSTCNLPNNATVSDVEKAYIKSWKLGLKGITVYRDGSLSTQPVNFGKVDDKNEELEFDPAFHAEPIKLPLKRNGETVKFKSPHGSVYITCNKYKNEIVEIFLSMGKSGQLESLLMKNLSKQISKSLHHRVPIDTILGQMEGEGGHPFWFKLDEDKDINVSTESVLDAIAKMIRYHFVGDAVDGYRLDSTTPVDSSLDICPVCRNRTLQRGAGCRGGSCIDPQCGYAACG